MTIKMFRNCLASLSLLLPFRDGVQLQSRIGLSGPLKFAVMEYCISDSYKPMIGEAEQTSM